MPGAGARAIDIDVVCEADPLGLSAKYALGGWRTADVAETNEQYAYNQRPLPICGPPRYIGAIVLFEEAL